MDSEELNMEEVLQNELSRVKNDISELYSLDRSRQEGYAEISERLARVETDHANVKVNMADVKNDLDKMKNELTSVKDKVEKVDAKVDRVDSKVDGVNMRVDNLKTELIAEIHKAKETRWQPKDWCIVIVAFLSLAGTVLTAILSQ